MKNNFFLGWLRLLPFTCMFALMATQQLSAQCPTTTYSVGSGVGVANLSGAPAGVATLTAGQSVKITGTFTVDVGTWNMNGADVYFATTASEIIVNATRTLSASTTMFQPCPGTASWSAVRVLSGGTITASSCIFTGGTNAVYIVAAATFTLTNNTFDANTNCLRIGGSQNPLNHTVTNNIFRNSTKAVYFTGSNVVLGYNTYYKTGSPGMTGIYVNNGQRLVVNGGNMQNMYRGLEITPSSGQCVEMGSVVFSGLTGVYANQASNALYIHDCTIRATETAVDISNHVTSASSPSPTCDGNINILRNFISSLTETGVRIHTTSGDGAINVIANQVASEIASTTAFTHYAIEIVQATKAAVTVETNTVVNQGTTQPTVPGGIYLYNCKKSSSVSYNVVTAGGFGGFGELQFGIMAVNSPHCLVRGNDVDGGPNIMDRGISIENPMDDIELCCNTLNQAERGLNMMGPHENCFIQTSVFNNHSEAL